MLIYELVLEIAKESKDILFIVQSVSDQNEFFNRLPEDIKRGIVEEVLSME